MKPDKDYITALVMWAGGPMAILPYTALTTDVRSESPLNVNVQGFWGTFWFRVAQDMKYFRRQFHDEVLNTDTIARFPDNWTVMIPPTVPSKVQEANDQVFTGDPQIKIEVPEGFRSGDKRAELESLFSKFCMGLIQQEERDSDVSPLDLQKQNTIGYGLGCRSLLLDIADYPQKPKRKPRENVNAYKERVNEYEQKRRRMTPFKVRSIHPLNICYDRTTSPPKWVIVRTPINRWEAKDQYPSWDAPSSGDVNNPHAGSTPLAKVEFWTADHYAVYIAGNAALGPDDHADEDGVAPNIYGFIPFWFSAGGHGDQDPYGRPEYELKGIIANARDSFLADAIIFNQEEIYRFRASYGPKIVVTGPDDTVRDQIVKDVMTGPQKAVSAPTGYLVSEINPTQMPSVLIDQRERVKKDIDAATIYDVASGSGTPTEAAARTRIRLEQVGKRLTQSALHVQQTVEQSSLAALYMIRDVLKEPVGVNVAERGQPANFVNIKPEDIPDGLVARVDLTGLTAEEKAREIQIGETRLKDGTLDMYGFMRDYAHDPDPDATMVGLATDTLRKNVIWPALVNVFQQGIQSMLMQKAQADAEQSTAPAATTGNAATPSADNSPVQPGLNVGTNGAVIPGEQGENPTAQRPGSPEAINQGLRLQSLPPLVPRRGPPVVKG